MYLFDKCGIFIDFDNPKCLYCYHIIYNNSSFGDLLLQQDLFVCPSCNEGYTIIIKDGIITCAFFTCIDIEIISYNNKNEFGIKHFYSKLKDFIWIPEFNIDFSDKQSLHEKLKTYLLLS